MRGLVALPLLLAACQEGPVLQKIDTDVAPFDTDFVLGAPVPDIQVEPEELRFPTIEADCEAPEQVITISNVGEADLRLEDIEIRGQDAGAYTVRLPKARFVAPGESVEAAVRFLPTAFHLYENARVVITSNDPDEATLRVPVAGRGAAAAYHEELFVQVAQRNVDVLWAIDNSCSMGEEVAQLKQDFHYFIDAFSNLGLDYRIAAVTADGSSNCGVINDWVDPSTPDPIGAFTAQVDMVLNATGPFSGCWAEEGFAAAKTTLTNNPDFMRSDATLAVIAVSDEPEQSGMKPDEFALWLQGLKGNPNDVSFSAYVGPASGSGSIFGDMFDVCPAGSKANADAAPKYHEAIRLTGGVWGDLCRFNIAPFLQHASYVAAGLEDTFPLALVPLSVTAIEVTVDGVPVSMDRTRYEGWDYDPSTNSIRFYGAAIPDPGATIEVSYPWDSGCTE